MNSYQNNINKKKSSEKKNHKNDNYNSIIVNTIILSKLEIKHFYDNYNLV